jgi:hypothetical protein
MKKAIIFTLFSTFSLIGLSVSTNHGSLSLTIQQLNDYQFNVNVYTNMHQSHDAYGKPTTYPVETCQISDNTLQNRSLPAYTYSAPYVTFVTTPAWYGQVVAPVPQTSYIPPPVQQVRYVQPVFLAPPPLLQVCGGCGRTSCTCNNGGSRILRSYNRNRWGNAPRYRSGRSCGY